MISSLYKNILRTALAVLSKMKQKDGLHETDYLEAWMDALTWVLEDKD